VIGADLADTLARFGAALRTGGIAVDVARLEAYACGLGAQAPGPFEVYWYARFAFLGSIEQLPVFDRIFDAFWAGEREIAPPDDRRSAGDDTGALPRQREVRGSRERETGVEDGAERSGADDRRAERLVTAASEERLQELDFSAFSPEEWRVAQRLMRALPRTAEVRKARRTRVRSRGAHLDVGAVIREDLRTLGQRTALRYRVRRTTLRPIVMLVDVSGSMAGYARALIQYGYVLVRSRPRVAVFSFATRLTDLTHALATARSAAAFERVVRGVIDRGSGTLIGTSMQAFNRQFGIGGVARGATVAIVSDGFEREDPALLAREMATLARLSRRIVWVNPRASDPQYEPLTRGMQAALPFIDTLLSGHNLRSLAAVAEAMRGATPR
jgi:uncharacterized protein with von Willebrand factor type A (vWA) domain